MAGGAAGSPHTWAAASTLIAFGVIVVIGFDKFSRLEQTEVPAPRVHMEPLPPRVHPEPAKAVPDWGIALHDPRGASWGSAIVGRPATRSRPMGTSVAGYVIVPARTTEIAPRKPRAKPAPARIPVDPRVKRDDADANIRLRAPTKSMASRRVGGNGGRLILEPRTMVLFAELEARWGERLEVRWAYRDPKLNRKVGGAGKSMHLQKKALDIVHGGWSRAKMASFVRLAYSLGFRGFGLGRNVVHIDTRARFTSWNYGGNPYGLAYRMVSGGRHAGPTYGKGASGKHTVRTHATKKPVAKKTAKKKAVPHKQAVKHRVLRRKPLKQ